MDTLHGHALHTRKALHPAVGIFLDTVRGQALVTRVGLLGLQATAAGTHAALSIVHGLLERVLFPSEHIVAVLAVPGVVSHAEVEGLRAVGGPFSFVVELAGVPDDLRLLV